MWEYVALEDKQGAGAEHSCLIRAGWEQWILVPWSGKAGRICIMRRLKQNANVHSHVGSNPFCLCHQCSELYQRRPKDEPRMWTEKGLVALMKQTWLVGPSPRQCMKEELVESIIEDAHTEADMQTAYAKELQKRNEELQGRLSEQQETIFYLTDKLKQTEIARDALIRDCRFFSSRIKQKEETNG